MNLDVLCSVTYVAAALVFLVRIRFREPIGVYPICLGCDYDLAGLGPEVACPECGKRERKPVDQPGMDVVLYGYRALYLAAAVAAWIAVWTAHHEYPSRALLRQMVREGFNEHAAKVWISFNPPSVTVFKTPSTISLEYIVLACYAITPLFVGFTNLRHAWLAGMISVALGTVASVIAHLLH